MLVSAVGQQQHACISTAGVVAHGAAAPHSVHPRGQLSIPHPRGTSEASAQQGVGRLTQKPHHAVQHETAPTALAIAIARRGTIRACDLTLERVLEHLI